MALSNCFNYNVTMKKSTEIIGKNRKALNLCLIIANLAVLAVLGFALSQRHSFKAEQVANRASSSPEQAKKNDKKTTQKR
ncbi:protein of unknown function [Streptococcus thermophilus]|nr:hypothetical protein [Streptococcus thermophilus]CAD0147044.1 protein of unknown function [Streptococcus thermophilus]CAD0150905.1 protein of unknown function [Streptococcus thermophilus]